MFNYEAFKKLAPVLVSFKTQESQKCHLINFSQADWLSSLSATLWCRPRVDSEKGERLFGAQRQSQTT
jgi:hypothetical protein